MTVKIHGIKNCDTMKKAFTWLTSQGISYDFHDYKTAGIDRPSLERWTDKVGWQVLLNKAGTTFRNLPHKEKTEIDRQKAIELMLREPSMIKRPVFVRGDEVIVGFKPETGALDVLKS